MNVYLLVHVFFLSKGMIYEINTLHVADLVNITFLQFSLFHDTMSQKKMKETLDTNFLVVK